MLNKDKVLKDEVLNKVNGGTIDSSNNIEYDPVPISQFAEGQEVVVYRNGQFICCGTITSDADTFEYQNLIYVKYREEYGYTNVKYYLQYAGFGEVKIRAEERLGFKVYRVIKY